MPLVCVFVWLTCGVCVCVWVSLTCGVDSAPLVCVVLQHHGRTLIDQYIHTLHVTLKRRQTQSRVTLRCPHVQIQQRLDQNLQSVMVTVIRLETHTHTTSVFKWHYCNQHKKKKILTQILTLKSDWMSHILKHSNWSLTWMLILNWTNRPYYLVEDLFIVIIIYIFNYLMNIGAFFMFWTLCLTTL